MTDEATASTAAAVLLENKPQSLELVVSVALEGATAELRSSSVGGTRLAHAKLDVVARYIERTLCRRPSIRRARFLGAVHRPRALQQIQGGDAGAGELGRGPLAAAEPGQR